MHRLQWKGRNGQNQRALSTGVSLFPISQAGRRHFPMSVPDRLGHGILATPELLQQL